MTVVKNRVSDEAMEKALTTAFADQEEIMESIIDRWIEKGRQEVRQTLEMEVEERVRLEREKAQQEHLANRRKTILLILNHGLVLSEKDSEEITAWLAKIEDQAELDKLTNAALDAAKTGLLSFITQLSPVDKSDTK